MDEDNELQDDQLDTDGDTNGEDSGSGSAPPKDDQPPKDEKSRINGLMSNWQTEQARANRLQAELDALKGGQGAPAAGGSGDGDTDEFKEFARENARVTLFNSDPRLAEAGLTAEDITGTTLTEMRASLKRQVSTVNGIEGRLRNKILAEHGLSPEVATGAGTEKTPSFTTMTDKQFNDYLADRDSRPR